MLHMKTLCNSKNTHIYLLLFYFYFDSRLFSITTKLSVSKSAHPHKSLAEQHQGYGGFLIYRQYWVIWFFTMKVEHLPFWFARLGALIQPDMKEKTLRVVRFRFPSSFSPKWSTVISRLRSWPRLMCFSTRNLQCGTRHWWNVPLKSCRRPFPQFHFLYQPIRQNIAVRKLHRIFHRLDEARQRHSTALYTRKMLAFWRWVEKCMWCCFLEFDWSNSHTQNMNMKWCDALIMRAVVL